MPKGSSAIAGRDNVGCAVILGFVWLVHFGLMAWLCTIVLRRGIANWHPVALVAMAAGLIFVLIGWFYLAKAIMLVIGGASRRRGSE